MSELLTDEEHELVGLLGRCFNMFCRITSQEDARPADLAEIADKIHQLQSAVLAQAAARAYPELYRTLGGWPVVAAEKKP